MRILRRICKRADVADSQRRVDDAKARRAAAEAQARATYRLAEQSRTVTERLRNEVEKNGWTELLQHAWGAR